MTQRIGIVTVSGRVLGGALWKPKDKDGKLRYNVNFGLDPATVDQQLAKIAAAKKQVVEEMWAGKKRVDLRNDWVVREGDDPEYPSHGFKFINAKSKNPFKKYVKRNGKPEEVTEEEGLIYAGCWAYLSMRIYGMEDAQRNVKPTLTVEPRALMFWKHDDPIGNTVDAESEFDGFESDYDTSDPFNNG